VTSVTPRARRQSARGVAASGGEATQVKVGVRARSSQGCRRQAVLGLTALGCHALVRSQRLGARWRSGKGPRWCEARYGVEPWFRPAARARSRFVEGQGGSRCDGSLTTAAEGSSGRDGAPVNATW
jgi:hypothetical protein